MADAVTHRGAGILFVTPDGKALFLKRGDGGDAPGAWCFPGGTTEGDETAEQTAIREAIEELGSRPKGSLAYHTRTITPVVTINPGLTGTDAPVSDAVDFTTFIQSVDEEFSPKLNGEHTGWAWAPITQPPEPLHPGCRVALDRIGWDELGVARAIRDGILTSPQIYSNVWLYDIRITGTGVAYRGAKMDADGKEISPEEFVYRKPENYLHADFLERCQGLSVIYKHPAKVILDSDEFAARVVGSAMLPYIKGDEVWAVVKIYDADMISMLQSEQMSTSPAVLLGNGDTKIKLESGDNILIEGPPSLMDHICLTKAGVWDKQGAAGPGVRADSYDVEIKVTSPWLIQGNLKKLDALASKAIDIRLDGINRRMRG